MRGIAHIPHVYVPVYVVPSQPKCRSNLVLDHEGIKAKEEPPNFIPLPATTTTAERSDMERGL